MALHERAFELRIHLNVLCLVVYLAGWALCVYVRGVLILAGALVAHGVDGCALLLRKHR